MDSFQGTKSDETSKPKKSKKKKKSAEALVVPEQEVVPEPEVEPQNDIVIEDSEDNAMDLVVEEQVNNTIFYTTTSKLFLFTFELSTHAYKTLFLKATMTSLHYKY